MQGSRGETGLEPGDEAGGECAALETGFDVCREGWVSFSHPTNQKKKCCRSNMKPSKMQQTAGCRERAAGSEVSWWAWAGCWCLWTDRPLFSDSPLQPLASVRRQEKREEPMLTVTHCHRLSRCLWRGRKCPSPGSSWPAAVGRKRRKWR